MIGSQSPSTLYLKCANFRNKCPARASKRKDTGDTFVTKPRHSILCHHVEEPKIEMAVTWMRTILKWSWSQMQQGTEQETHRFLVKHKKYVDYM